MVIRTRILLLLGIALAAAPLSAANRLDQNGNRFELKDLKGQITVLDFAASWCDPCWKALPYLQELAASQPGLKILVLSEDNRAAGRDKLVKKLGLTMPVIWDEGHAWAKVFEPKGMPTTLILDKDGEVIYRHEGFSPEKWQEFLDKLNFVQTSGS